MLPCMTQHKTPAQLRADAEAPLVKIGKRRKQLLAELAEIDTELRPLVVTAVRMEVPYRRIHELTGIAPNTAMKWRREADSAESP